MNLPTFMMYFASAVSMVLVIYAAYLMVKDSKGNFAKAFRVIIGGHIPSAVMNLLTATQYLDNGIMPPEAALLYPAFNHIAHAISALSVFIAVYLVKKELYDKIAQFTKRIGGVRSD